MICSLVVKMICISNLSFEKYVFILVMILLTLVLLKNNLAEISVKDGSEIRMYFKTSI